MDGEFPLSSRVLGLKYCVMIKNFCSKIIPPCKYIFMQMNYLLVNTYGIFLDFQNVFYYYFTYI